MQSLFVVVYPDGTFVTEGIELSLTEPDVAAVVAALDKELGGKGKWVIKELMLQAHTNTRAAGAAGTAANLITSQLKGSMGIKAEDKPTWVRLWFPLHTEEVGNETAIIQLRGHKL
jgi:hypothetical protein